MSKRELRYEAWLTALASHFEARNATRLVYDDHLAGDKLAMALWLPAGFVELHIWRQSSGSAFVHLLADSPAAAEGFSQGLEALAVELPWHARASRSFIRKLRDLAKELGESFHQRAEGYPKDALAQLGAAFPAVTEMIGVAATIGTGSEALAMPMPGRKQPRLWGAAVRLELGDRAGLWHPGLRGWVLPREAHVHLLRHLAPEQRANLRQFAIADDLHSLNPTESLELQRPAADAQPYYRNCTLSELLWCSADSCFYCDFLDCGDGVGSSLDCDMPSFDCIDCGS